ncbi:MAG: alpha/beta hydrolase [Alphaproteobacteria bacterium]|nr:alpha/beta hydrolase [Alphaproteobacteria bacterium]MBP7759006.1 alpha/beta hydrolase [Alphaproteobacteria bacterium]MBP7762280.1 alpha/beta hydrolase [Alphaproteobacteria bacterium]
MTMLVYDTRMSHDIRQKSLPNLGLDIAYTDTGPENGRVLFCVHGLLSNGRDYDFLATHMAAQGRRVIAMDLPGRGKSSRFDEPGFYTLGAYLPFCLELTKVITQGRPFDWLGVSLGGMIGMSLHNHADLKMERLILVDIGPEIPGPALDLVSGLAKAPTHYATKEEAVAFLKKRCAAWGITDPAVWEHLIAHDIIAQPDGSYKMHYDPAIGAALKEQGNETLAFWEGWALIKQPLLLIRGGQSVILPRDIADRMQREYTGPSMETITFPFCGHVPNLMQPEQIEPLADWLRASQRVV